MVNYRHFGHVRSTCSPLTNTMDNVPGPKSGEYVITRDDARRTRRLRNEQKSLAFMKELIEKFSQPEELVVDLCCGTFSPALGCLLLSKYKKSSDARGMLSAFYMQEGMSSIDWHLRFRTEHRAFRLHRNFEMHQEKSCSVQVVWGNSRCGKHLLDDLHFKAFHHTYCSTAIMSLEHRNFSGTERGLLTRGLKCIKGSLTIWIGPFYEISMLWASVENGVGSNSISKCWKCNVSNQKVFISRIHALKMLAMTLRGKPRMGILIAVRRTI